MGNKDFSQRILECRVQIHEVISNVYSCSNIFLLLTAGKTAITVTNERSILRIQKPVEVLV
jgi:hypothetical protein